MGRILKPKAPKLSAYEIVTERIIKQLESGVAPWQKPWKASTQLPRNFVSGKEYRGINVWMLLSAGYTSPYWLTYKQAQDLGGNVKKGEKSSIVVLWQFGTREVENPETHLTENKKSVLFRFYYVFNTEQCENLKKEVPVHVNEEELAPIDACEKLVEGWMTKPTIKYGFNQAAYSKLTDRIEMPKMEQFNSAEEFYSTLFHEMTHSTGHQSRLNRDTLQEFKRFGDEEYSKEELVAEMGAAYLCGFTGIENKTINNSASYLKHWIGKLKDDPKLIVYASAAAQKAADLIIGRKYEAAPETTDSNESVESNEMAVV